MKPSSGSLPKVDPSARDPIGSWLDVFIALLALPRAQRQTIRDELEDHLRSRVDDLLITGMSEPEAVRAAVGELGETADLARAFRTAARPPHTRRLLMTAAACTTIGAALAIGIATLTGAPSAPAQHAADPSPALAAASDTPRIALRGATFGQLFDTLGQHTPQPVLIHWDRLEQNGITPDTEVGLDVDPLPSYVVHRLLLERAEALGVEPIAIQESDEVLEISTQSHFDQRTMELRAYDIRDLIEMRSGIDAITLLYSGESGAWREASDAVYENVARLIGSDNWASWGGGLAHGQTVGASLVIGAPARLHVRIEQVLTLLRDDAARTRELARKASEQEVSRRESLIHRLTRQLDEANTEYAHSTSHRQRMLLDASSATSQNKLDEAQGLNTEIALLEGVIELAQRRRGALQEQILRLEEDQSHREAGL